MNSKITESNLLKITFGLTVFSTMYLCSYTPVRYLGMICAVCALFIGGMFFWTRTLKSSIEYSISICLLTALYLVIHLFFVGKGAGAYFVIQIIGFYGLFLALRNVKLDIKMFLKIKKIMRCLYYCVIIVYFFVNLFNMKEMLDIIISPTILKILLPLSLFSLDEHNKKMYFLEVCIFILFSFILGERTTAVCMLGIFFLNYVLRKISYKGSCLLFMSILILNVLFPLVYVVLSNSPMGILLNQLSRQYTGENFFSGRDVIWSTVFYGVKDNWLFGLGFGNNLLEEHGINLSTHNLYMYLLLNGGIVLVILFIFFMYGIWKYMKPALVRKNPYALRGASYFIGLLVFLDMELFLLANNVVVSLIWWETIAFLLAFLEMKNRQVQKV